MLELAHLPNYKLLFSSVGIWYHWNVAVSTEENAAQTVNPEVSAATLPLQTGKIAYTDNREIFLRAA